MYYEERIIGGVLMFRNRPNGDWSQCSIAKMGERIIACEDAIARLRGQLQNAANHLDRARNRGLDKNDALRTASEHANAVLHETLGL